MKVESQNVVHKLRQLQQAAARDNGVSVVVGYTGAHALALHEITPKHKGKPRPSGKGVRWGPSMYGSKFLEGPARQFAKVVGSLIVESYKQGGKLLQALYVGGLRIQRESQMRVPVEYGDLRRSGFCEKE